MIKIGPIDLEFLFLANRKNGLFNENDIENSSLKKIGTGKILDYLGTLCERKLIMMNKDGTFSTTSLAHQILWDSKTPLRIRILRLLEIKSQPQRRIIQILNEDSEKVNQELETIRKKGFAMMAPIRLDLKLEKMFEILPDGLEWLNKDDLNRSNNNFLNGNITHEDLKKILEEIKNQILGQESIDKNVQQSILDKLNQVKKNL